MRLAVRLLRPAPNQNIKNPRLWQDPVLGYFETHGKTEVSFFQNQNDKKKCYKIRDIIMPPFSMLYRHWDTKNYKKRWQMPPFGV